MEKIYQHIENLLAHHEFVAVPGLGGFVLQIKSAYIQDNKIFAPQKYVAFNAMISDSDGLLAIEISRTEQVSFRNACELIEKEISEYKQILYQNKSLEFGDLGSFSIDNEGNIHFTPNYQATFIPHNFGLKNHELIHTARKIALNTQKRKKEYRNLLRIAAMFILVLGSIFMGNYNSNIHQQSASILNFVPKPKIVAISIITDSIKDTTAVKQQAKTIKSGISKEKFHIIVACLPTQKTADEYLHFLASKNYNKCEILTPKNIYRISIQSFTTMDDAVKCMEELRLTDPVFENAWVMREK